MTELTQALFRIDPTEGLLQYVQSIKPYHSKVLDVFVEYVYTEPMRVSFRERLGLAVGLEEPVYPLVYSGGYGAVWSPHNSAQPLNIPAANIISARGDNTFLVTGSPPIQHQCIVSNLATNQLTFCYPFNVLSIIASTRQITLTGDATASPYNLANGDTVYIRNNTDTVTNAKYTVSTVTFALGQTTVIVTEPISLSATGTGTINIPVGPNDVPYTSNGAAVGLYTAGILPAPTITTGTYFFQATSKPGVFNLANVRFPREYSDYVNLASFGTGQLTVARTEPFVPGQTIQVTGSFNGENDGVYYVNNQTPESSNFRIHVIQHINRPTPIGQPSDGSMILQSGGYGDPFSTATQSPDLFVGTFFSERIEFDFGPMPVQPYLLDTFSGTGTLVGHTTDSGHAWTVTLGDTLDQLIRDGSTSGNLVTSNVNITAYSNWSIPTAPYALEVEVYVGPKPSSSAPVFRFFIFEGGPTPVLGPMVDIRPNADGTIWIDVFDGDTATSVPSYTNSTGVFVDRKLKVKMQVTTAGALEVLVNNIPTYSAGSVTWPSLLQSGFNFTVPSGDPTQFVLDRILGKGVSLTAPPVTLPTPRIAAVFDTSADSPSASGSIPLQGLALHLDASVTSSVVTSGGQVQSWTDLISGTAFTPSSSNAPVIVPAGTDAVFGPRAISFVSAGQAIFGPSLQCTTPINFGEFITVFVIGRGVFPVADAYTPTALYLGDDYSPFTFDSVFAPVDPVLAGSNIFAQQGLYPQQATDEYTFSARDDVGSVSVINRTAGAPYYNYNLVSSCGTNMRRQRCNGVDLLSTVTGAPMNFTLKYVMPQTSTAQNIAILGEIIIYNRTLSSTEIVQVENYLNAKWT